MDSGTGPFVLRAPAKLNLTLDVGPVQPNGLHEIRSVMADLQLADDLEFRPSRGPFGVANDRLAVPERANLAWRAAMALRPELTGWNIFVRKRVPVQAGLGGGSADAAAALRGVARIMMQSGVSMVDARLFMIASQLGSDVAACLVPGLKIVRGTGERVEQIAAPAPPWGLLLLQPRSRVPTSHAYRMLDQSRSSGTPQLGPDNSREICDAYTSGDLDRASALMHNDFQSVIEAAFADIREARERLLGAGAIAALLCGSGSCVAGFFNSRENAESARAALAVRPDGWTAVTAFADAA